MKILKCGLVARLLFLVVAIPLLLPSLFAMFWPCVYCKDSVFAILVLLCCRNDLAMIMQCLVNYAMTVPLQGLDNDCAMRCCCK